MGILFTDSYYIINEDKVKLYCDKLRNYHMFKNTSQNYVYGLS